MLAEGDLALLRINVKTSWGNNFKLHSIQARLCVCVLRRVFQPKPFNSVVREKYNQYERKRSIVNRVKTQAFRSAAKHNLTTFNSCETSSVESYRSLFMMQLAIRLSLECEDNIFEPSEYIDRYS